MSGFWIFASDLLWPAVSTVLVWDFRCKIFHEIVNLRDEIVSDAYQCNELISTVPESDLWTGTALDL